MSLAANHVSLAADHVFFAEGMCLFRRSHVFFGAEASRLFGGDLVFFGTDPTAPAGLAAGRGTAADRAERLPGAEPHGLPSPRRGGGGDG